ncbi:Cysteine-rich, DPF motif domain containing 1 [Halocaridina rubra]|uniref:Cysteine-rich DPF motif domain-containing protein 1 n=1 Tax=Halocaridina rubra TaxID=373956 RepID=A0AAN8WIU2_HALRR
MTSQSKTSEEEKCFRCEVCGLQETYHYYGKKPPFNKNVTFLEDCYLLQDPFQSWGSESFLLLGSSCTVCKRVVCQSTACSIFYTKRFCIDCAKSQSDEFPPEVRNRLK